MFLNTKDLVCHRNRLKTKKMITLVYLLNKGYKSLVNTYIAHSKGWRKENTSRIL